MFTFWPCSWSTCRSNAAAFKTSSNHISAKTKSFMKWSKVSVQTSEPTEEADWETAGGFPWCHVGTAAVSAKVNIRNITTQQRRSSLALKPCFLLQALSALTKKGHVGSTCSNRRWWWCYRWWWWYTENICNTNTAANKMQNLDDLTRSCEIGTAMSERALCAAVYVVEPSTCSHVNIKG